MKPIHFIMEDEALLAVNKAPNLLTIPDRYNRNKPNLYHMLLAKYSELFIVHRLDRETSGIILFAKSKDAHKWVNDQFVARNVNKTYWALCLGPNSDSGTIDVPILENDQRKGFYIPSAKGKPSVTHYAVLQRFGKYALVELRPITGRTHQIRVHLKSIHSQLMVDAKYGLADSFFLSEIKKIRLAKSSEESPLIQRSSLHARSIQFTHPLSGEKVCYQASLPKDMKACINQLNKVFN